MSFSAFVVTGSIIGVATLVAVLLLARWRGLAIGVAFAGAAALLLVHGLGYVRLFFDDSYISLRYAQNLADGLGPNWNSEGRVEGYTNFLWMAVLAGVAKLGLDLVFAARALAIVAMLATFLVVHQVWRLWGDEEPESGITSPLLLAAVLLAIALSDSVAWWGFSGMETPLFMALIAAGAYLYFLERRGAPFPWSAVVFAAAAMTRPEGLIVAAVTGVFKGAEVVRTSNAGTSDVPRALRKYLSWAALFLVVYGAYFLWRYTYYDYLLPNTFYAKVGATSAIIDRGLDYVWLYGRYQLLPLILGTALLLGMASRLRHDALYILAVTGAMLLGMVVEGGDAFAHGRFIAPLLPLLYLGGLAGFATVLKRARLDPAPAGLLVVTVLGLGAFALFRGTDDFFVARERVAHDERQLLGTWLSEHTPADYTIAAYAVGAIGYYSDRDILDMLGLNDVVIAHTDVPDLGEGIGGHERYNVDYVLDEVRPELIVTNDADPGPATQEELRQRFRLPSPVEARDQLLTDPRLWDRYVVRSLNIEGTWFNFLQRRDTVGELEAQGLQ